MKFAIICFVAGSSAITVRDPTEETLVQTEGDKWTNWPNTQWTLPQPNFAGAPERVHVLDPVQYQSRANTPSYLGNRRTTFYGQLAADPNWPNTKWTPPQPNFAGAPEKVLVPDPVAYQSRANTPSYLGNRRTTFYGQVGSEGNNWPNTKWTPPQPNFSGAPEKVLVPDPVAYQSRANTPSYLGNRRTTFYAQTEGDDQPEGTNQGVNQLIVTQKDKRWQERLFRKAFRPKNVSPKQWNPTPASLAQWGETNVDAMPAATRAFADKATEAGKFASWNKPFAQIQTKEDMIMQDDKKKEGDDEEEKECKEEEEKDGDKKEAKKGDEKKESKCKKPSPPPEKVSIIDPNAFQVIANAAGKDKEYHQTARAERDFDMDGQFSNSHHVYRPGY